MRRQVSSRSALRARAKSLPLLSAAEARRRLPERAFAATLGLFGRQANSVPARADAPTNAGDRSTGKDGSSKPTELNDRLHLPRNSPSAGNGSSGLFPITRHTLSG
jgi:hypothetical protein